VSPQNNTVVVRFGITDQGVDAWEDVIASVVEQALRLCAEIREQNRCKRFSAAAMQCWGCVTFSKGDPDKMCLSNKPGNRGCNLVNTRYERHRKEEAIP
jgi:hypothetical protein